MNKLNKFLVLQKNIKLIIALILFGSFYNTQAQDRIPYDQGTKYILANVDVTGKINFNPQTVNNGGLAATVNWYLRKIGQ